MEQKLFKRNISTLYITHGMYGMTCSCMKKKAFANTNRKKKKRQYKIDAGGQSI